MLSDMDWPLYSAESLEFKGVEEEGQTGDVGVNADFNNQTLRQVRRCRIGRDETLVCCNQAV